MIWGVTDNSFVLSMYIITMMTGLPGNLLSLYAFIRKVKQEVKLTDVLLLNLNISDLIFLIFLPILIKATAEMEWGMSSYLCPLATYIFLINIYNSTLILTAVSVERYLGVIFAIKYKLNRHPRYAVITSVIIWVINLGHCSIVYYMQYNFSDGIKVGLDPINHNTCYWQFTEDQLKILLPECLGISIVFIFVPLIICCFCYINIIRALYQLDNIKPRKRCRAIGLAMSTLLIFMICSIPFGVSHVEGYIINSRPSWRVYALVSSSISVSLDTIVFYCSSKALRNTFMDHIPRLLMWLQHCCRCLFTDSDHTQHESTIFENN
ncbi:free fatty acid receptor 2-like [Tachysurus fulvidraco]|uniref:free fatty acid receptor 2-like n=1 Tax=Tachysurus fulvidraco TaxID=1234273 RepID=UPI000F5171A3|nr:free fatty acid receptor 2-like [Tachysurus fulvidraco]